MNVYLSITAGGTGGAPLPLTISFRNISTATSTGWLFGHSNAATTPLQFVGGVYAAWYQSDPLWPTKHEQALYAALLKSMRKALPAGALLLTTHFGETNWAASHGGAATTNTPLFELGIMLADGPLADGMMIWWDQIGILKDIKNQRGIFSPAVSAGCCKHCTACGCCTERYPLTTKFIGRKSLPLGWFARYIKTNVRATTSYGDAAGGSALTVQMIEVNDKALSSGRNFRKVVTVDGKTLYNTTAGNCSKIDQGGEGGWTARPCSGKGHDHGACEDH